MKKVANIAGAVGACGVLACGFLTIIAFAVATMLFGTEYHKLGSVMISSAFIGCGVSCLIWALALAYCSHKNC